MSVYSKDTVHRTFLTIKARTVMGNGVDEGQNESSFQINYGKTVSY